MRRKNFIKEKLISGQPVIGTWSIIPSPVTADIIASTGLDFFIIDSEHGPISFETAQNMVMASESRGVSPVMRVGTINEGDILKALDIGVHVIQIPNINCKQDVVKIIDFSKYLPLGNRGFSPFTRAGNYSQKIHLNFPK
jgi:4-hydroxy-2-oxoheptanedioate aldolase